MTDKLHTWHYLCDTCRLSGYEMGIFGPPDTEWECWANWEDGKKPFMKIAVNGEHEPHEMCPHYANALAERLRGEGKGDEA